MSLYVPNPDFAAEFTVSEEMVNLLHPVAVTISEQAKAIAPVESGEYRDSIRAEANRVLTDDDKGPFIEFGTVDTPTFAPFRRAAEQVVGTMNVRR